ncbi:MAG: hypothetical protein ABIQ12_15405, partial [Opitutaceae bacterium]
MKKPGKIVPKISRPRGAPAANASSPAAAEKHTPAGHPSFPIVGLGASAGGLEALTELFKH